MSINQREKNKMFVKVDNGTEQNNMEVSSNGYISQREKNKMFAKVDNGTEQNNMAVSSNGYISQREKNNEVFISQEYNLHGLKKARNMNESFCDSKILNDKNLELEIETSKRKSSLEYLYKYFIDKNCFRVINSNLYIYEHEYGYLRCIEKNKEEIEINKLIAPEDRRFTHPTTIYNLIKKIKSDPDLQISHESINKHKGLINCKNGVVDVINGCLMDHSREYKFSYVINANYNTNKTINSNHFKDFIDTSLEGDLKKVELLLEIIGYLVSGYINAKKAFVFLGKPHSGKSVLSRLIAYMVGEDNVSNIAIHKLGDRFSIAQYSKKKLNICAEIGSTSIKNIEVFKAMVGNDYLQGEYKGKDLFSSKSEIKLLFCGNQMPSIFDNEVSDAFTDRLIFLKFNKSTPIDKIDYELEKKLISEIDDIFTISINRLSNLIKRNFRFTNPYDSNEFAQNYRNKQNHINEFLSECCIINEEQKVHLKELYIGYTRFCEDNCITSYSEVKFGEYIENSNYNIKRSRFRINGKNLRGFIGVALKQLV